MSVVWILSITTISMPKYLFSVGWCQCTCDKMIIYTWHLADCISCCIRLLPDTIPTDYNTDRFRRSQINVFLHISTFMHSRQISCEKPYVLFFCTFSFWKDQQLINFVKKRLLAPCVTGASVVRLVPTSFWHPRGMFRAAKVLAPPVRPCRHGQLSQGTREFVSLFLVVDAVDVWNMFHSVIIMFLSLRLSLVVSFFLSSWSQTNFNLFFDKLHFDFRK